MRPLPRVSGKSARDIVGEPDQGDTVEVRQGDIGQGGRHLPGKVELGRRAERHAPRAIEQEVNVQILFLLESLESNVSRRAKRFQSR